MKKIIAILAIMLCMATASTAFARGGYGGHGGHYYGHHGGGHHNGLGLAFGLAGGLLLGSALWYATAPPPRTVVYAPPYPVYQPGVCVQDRTVTGEWQINRYDGRQVWVSYPYPVVRRYQVPCY